MSLPSDPSSIRVTRLENGVVVATETVPALRSASLGVYLDIGSRDEIPATNGLAHLFEHMVFKGTSTHGPLDIVKSFEATGGHVNAYTSKEQTCLYAKVVDTGVSPGLSMLLEMALDSTFDQKELDKEKEVIIEEIKGVTDNPDDYVYDLFSKACFNGQSLGFPIAGTAKTVKNLTRRDLLRHQKQTTQSLPLYVLAAGRVSHREVEDLTRKAFGLRTGSGKRGAKTGRPRPAPARPVAAWKPKHVMDKRPVQQATALLGGPGYAWDHPNRYALLLLNCVLGDGMSSRLFQRLREDHGLVYSIYSNPEFLINAGVFSIGFATESKDLRKAVDEICREIRAFKSEGIKESDLDFAKKNIRGGLLLGLESTNTRLANLSRQLMYGQPGETVDTILKKLDAVTRADVSACIRDIFTAKRWASAAVVPKNTRVSIGGLLDF